MSYNKFLILGAGLLLSAIASSNVVAATNCGISYYCYRSMTPGPAPAGNDVLVRRTTAASNRVAAAARRAQPQRPGTARTPQPQQRVQLTLEQRLAESRRREQQQQQALAQRRQRAAQQEQQRLAQQRQRAQQSAQSRQQSGQRPAQPAATSAQATRQQQLIASQRRAHQAAEQQRLAQQRRAAAANTQSVAETTSAATPQSAITPTVQTCAVISKKIAELSRQAVLRSKEKQYDQAQRLFKAVKQLKVEGEKNSCSEIV